MKEIAIVCIDENMTGNFEWQEVYNADDKSDTEIYNMFKEDFEDSYPDLFEEDNSECIRIDRVSLQDVK